MKIYQVIIFVCALGEPVCLPENAEAMVYGPIAEGETACREIAPGVLAETKRQAPETLASFICQPAREPAL